MKKHYEVTITAYATVIVKDVEDEAEALDYASADFNKGDFEISEAKIAGEIKPEKLADHERHADAVI